MTVKLSKYKPRVKYRLAHYTETKELFARFGIFINEVAFKGFCHTLEMIARNEKGNDVKISQFKINLSAGTITFHEQEVEIGNSIQGTGSSRLVVTYDGFEGVVAPELVGV